MLTRQLLHRQWLLLQMSILYYDGRLLIQSDGFNSNSNTHNSRYVYCALLHTLSIRWADSYPCAQSIPIAEYTHPFLAEFRKWRGGVYREGGENRAGSRGSPSASHTLSIFVLSLVYGRASTTDTCSGRADWRRLWYVYWRWLHRVLEYLYVGVGWVGLITVNILTIIYYICTIRQTVDKKSVL